MYIWGPSAFSFQVCSVSVIQLSLWSKWRPYLFLVFSFPYCCLLSITPWPFTDWLQLRPWISSSWTKVRLQCKNNKGKMPVLQSSTYSLQHLESNFTWDSHLSRASRLQFAIAFWSLQYFSAGTFLIAWARLSTFWIFWLIRSFTVYVLSIGSIVRS